MIARQMCKYGSFFLNSILARNQINNMKVGMALTHFNIRSMKKILCPLPPLSEQKRIVNKVKELTELCSKLENKINESQINSKLLMEAVLKEAFVY